MRVLMMLLLLLGSTGVAQAGSAPVRGDLDGDGRTDLVLRSYLTNLGPHEVWFMDGPTRLGVGGFTPARLTEDAESDLIPPTNIWYYCGAGDFDGDGRNDVLFTNEGFAVSGSEIWLLDPGLVRRQAVPLATPLGCKSVNDFDGDGDPDILFHTIDASPQLLVWRMQGTTPVGTLTPQPSAPANATWSVVGTGDFNLDGHPDILWQHSSSNVLVQWLMDASMVRIEGRFTNPPNMNWLPSGVGDFGTGPGSPAGVPDIVGFSDSLDNRGGCCRVMVWWMDADANVVGSSLMPSTQASWLHPIGPR